MPYNNETKPFLLVLSYSLCIFKTKNTGRLTFWLLFSKFQVREKSTKNGRFQCVETKVILVRNP